MLQAYVPNGLSVLDVCCSKSSMLQVVHEGGVGGGVGAQHGVDEYQGADEQQQGAGKQQRASP
jgi:hypothetical protein